jgi:hypothetical protein
MKGRVKENRQARIHKTFFKMFKHKFLILKVLYHFLDFSQKMVKLILLHNFF